MISSLDPKHFDGQLRIAWFPSAEGLTAEDALNQTLSSSDLPLIDRMIMTAFVRQDLSRIGYRRFVRHFEIKRIMSFRDDELFELRWRKDLSTRQLSLRMYFTLDMENSTVVGLCFREKKFHTSNSKTKLLQQQDILAARELARAYRSRVRGEQGH